MSAWPSDASFLLKLPSQPSLPGTHRFPQVNLMSSSRPLYRIPASPGLAAATWGWADYHKVGASPPPQTLQGNHQSACYSFLIPQKLSTAQDTINSNNQNPALEAPVGSCSRSTALQLGKGNQDQRGSGWFTLSQEMLGQESSCVLGAEPQGGPKKSPTSVMSWGSPLPAINPAGQGPCMSLSPRNELLT